MKLGITKRFKLPLKTEWLMFVLGAVVALAVVDTAFWIKIHVRLWRPNQRILLFHGFQAL